MPLNQRKSEGKIGPEGKLHLRLVRKEAPRTEVPAQQLTLKEMIHFGFPRKGLAPEVNRWRRANLPNLWRGLWKVALAQKLKLPHFYGQLSLVKIIAAADGEPLYWMDYGLASLRVVTTAGVNYLVDALQNLQEPENFKYHGLGTGTNAEAVGDTALQTELGTQYNPDNTRATGSLTEGASANIFRTVGTNTVDAAAAVTEHGVFTQAATGGGTLLDRSKFAALNLDPGDGLQSTYDFSISAGS